jgi:hypothetical protein
MGFRPAGSGLERATPKPAFRGSEIGAGGACATLGLPIPTRRPAVACIVGAYEHPTRKAPDKTVAQLHAECAAGALADAGLSLADVDGYFCAGDAPGMGAAVDGRLPEPEACAMRGTDLGGCSYLALVAHAAQAIAAGQVQRGADHAGRPAAQRGLQRHRSRARAPARPRHAWEAPFGLTTVNGYGMVAQRHMHQYGTTSEQLAWIKVAASHHAQHNPHAMLREAGDGGGRAGLAGHLRPAAPARLLRRQRRRRRAGRRPPRDRPQPAASPWSR